MDGIVIDLPVETDTAALGARLAPLLKVGDVVCLSGPLGAGKTTLARGLIRAFAGDADAPSPTFALVEVYEGDGLTLWHFDLYRLEKSEEVWELGLEEALAEGASVIEWPERIAAFLPVSALVLRLEPQGDSRRAMISPGGDWKARLEKAGIA
ncbi:MAG: tRNA (adenosine(37)-N6)-threonylcarbamoyltransferase complex ATPase subunit type 1 TsaE [Parvularculaceae bacterium]